MTDPQPRLYRELADWFHLLTAPHEYAEEAETYRRLLVEACDEPPRRVLELGSGGGNNASHLKAHFELTLVDPSPQMLELSRSLNPECRHLEGDMRDVRMGEQFDAVFVHDAVAYITTEEDLAAVIETASLHVRPGGAALFVPDFVRERFEPHIGSGGHDGTDRALRYLEWVTDPDPDDTTYLCDFAYLLRDGDGTVTCERDRHVCGLFPRATWLARIEAGGLVAESRVMPPHEEPAGAELFVGRRPRDSASAARGAASRK
ncbi:MAG TPA: class I SAM-dependent methyltransferase [Gaiellaceae bacterium]|nr:class I SAM-dependent methyltransferase [Gaiellaceae bacterium]